MNPSTYIPIIVLFIVLYIFWLNRKAVIAKKAVEKRKKEIKRKW